MKHRIVGRVAIPLLVASVLCVSQTAVASNDATKGVTTTTLFTCWDGNPLIGPPYPTEVRTTSDKTEDTLEHKGWFCSPLD
jgi:hypothetical protein